jgi:hypothetical protein
MRELAVFLTLLLSSYACSLWSAIFMMLVGTQLRQQADLSVEMPFQSPGLDDHLRAASPFLFAVPLPPLVFTSEEQSPSML